MKRLSKCEVQTSVTQKPRFWGQIKLGLSPQTVVFWRWATVLTFTYGSLLPHLRSGGLSSCVEGYWRGTEGITCLVSAGTSKFQSPPSGSQQSLPHLVHLLTFLMEWWLRIPVGTPQSSARPHRLCSVKAETRFFCSTLSRRREGVKLLFLLLQCKICQLGTVDRLPLCSFNCLPCVRASVCVCACVPWERLTHWLGQKRSWFQKMDLSLGTPVHDPNPQKQCRVS